MHARSDRSIEPRGRDRPHVARRSVGGLGLLLAVAARLGLVVVAAVVVVAVGVVVVVATPNVARAEPADQLPAASAVEKITWSTSPGATRLVFHGRGLVAPIVERASDAVVRVDFTAATAAAVPGRLDVGSGEVRSMTRVPSGAGLLPDGVSVRWLVLLSRPDVAWRLDRAGDRHVLLVGDAEKIGPVVAPQETGWAGIVAAPLAIQQGPLRDEMLERPLGIALPVDADLRAAPSALASRIGSVPAGDKRLVDARRGEWVHVASGGWLRLPQIRLPEAPAPGASRVGRTPVAWAVVTLGTGLDLQVEEVMPGDPEAAEIERLYSRPVRLARFRVGVDPATGYSFRLPSKQGRVVLDVGGDPVACLDPASLPLQDASSRARLDMAFAAPDLPPGTEWRTWLVFPADLDFLKVESARIDIDGRLHRLFRVPGSGESRQ